MFKAFEMMRLIAFGLFGAVLVFASISKAT